MLIITTLGKGIVQLSKQVVIIRVRYKIGAMYRKYHTATVFRMNISTIVCPSEIEQRRITPTECNTETLRDNTSFLNFSSASRGRYYSKVEPIKECSHGIQKIIFPSL